MKKIIIFTLVLVSFINKSYATNTTANTKATAQLTASCTISAQNIGFGSLILPLTTQSASSNMNVLCNKNASYTIGLAYGGIYGQVAAPNGSYWTAQYCVSGCSMASTSQEYYNQYTASGTYIGYGIYPYMQGPPNTTYNGTTNTYINNGTSYSYGELIGASKGDKVGYYIEVPGNPSKVWNTGNSTYTATGTGSNQSLSVKATLVPSQSGSNYPTPDVYMDTVTANINF